MEVKITKDNFEAEVVKAGRPVLVDFWATWCGPCMMLGPVVAEIAEERKDVIKVGKVNVDEEPELAAKFGIMSIPAVLLFKNGEVVANSVGYISKEDMNAFVSANILETEDRLSGRVPDLKGSRRGRILADLRVHAREDAEAQEQGDVHC